MRNILNTKMDSQTNPKIINVIKSVNNGEILRQDNNVWWTFAKKNPICYRSNEEQMIEFLQRESWKVFAI